MKDINPELKKLEKIICETSEESNTENLQTVKNTIQTLWPHHSFEKILENPTFYELPVLSVPLLTEDEYLDSLRNKKIPEKIIHNLILVKVEYRGFNNQIYNGQIIVHKELAYSTKQVFQRILRETDFPITSIIPLSFYNWNSSARYNNSGGFDWRFVDGNNEITDHAFGAAIDINPLINPWIRKNSHNRPYNPNIRGTLSPSSQVVTIFNEEGWKWGGNWKHSKDWQHFYRPEIPFKYYGKAEVKE